MESEEEKSRRVGEWMSKEGKDLAATKIELTFG
jgi:hypothetical protein